MPIDSACCLNKSYPLRIINLGMFCFAKLSSPWNDQVKNWETGRVVWITHRLLLYFEDNPYRSKYFMDKYMGKFLVD